MEIFYTIPILLLFSAVLGDDNLKNEGELKREKKDISKLQALLGLNKGKQIPVVNYQDWKRPLYYVPPCNCWRPTTRYGVPQDDTVVVYQTPAARPPVAFPAQPAINTAPQPSFVVPAQPALSTPQQPPSFVIPAEPARYVPPRPQVIIPASPALATPTDPCLHRDGGDGYNYDRPQVTLNH